MANSTEAGGADEHHNRVMKFAVSNSQVQRAVAKGWALIGRDRGIQNVYGHKCREVLFRFTRGDEFYEAVLTTLVDADVDTMLNDVAVTIDMAALRCLQRDD